MAKETANNGFIKIDRGILDWQHITEPVLVQVFIYLLVKANHKEGWWKGHKCERGATMVSIRTLCDDLAMSAHTAINALRTLESTGEIKRIRINQKTSKTIITKYSQYQDNNLFSVANTATQTATQTATKQERKERKEDTPPQDNNIRTHEEILSWFSNSQYLDNFAMNERVSTELALRLAKEAIDDWNLLGIEHRNESDAKRHLLSHIRKIVTTMREQGTLKATEEKTKRLAPLVKDCQELIDKGCDRKDVAEFYAYWTQESNDGTGRMNFEACRGWNTHTRFIRYKKKA